MWYYIFNINKPGEQDGYRNRNPHHNLANRTIPYSEICRLIGVWDIRVYREALRTMRFGLYYNLDYLLILKNKGVQSKIIVVK
jgi:hypothetical protein